MSEMGKETARARFWMFIARMAISKLSKAAKLTKPRTYGELLGSATCDGAVLLKNCPEPSHLVFILWLKIAPPAEERNQ